MGRENPSKYIRNSEEMIQNPAVCKVSQEEISLTNGVMVYLTADFQPVCDEHQSQARYIASVHRAGGYPNNGINPETGETEFFDSASWWNIQDLKLISRS